MLRNLNYSSGGKRILGTPKSGVLGSLIPSSGDNGAGYAYNDLSLPADASKEIRGEIVSWPASGTLYAYEDTSFTFTAPDGTYSFQYQLYVDGVATGSPVTVTLQVGPVTHAATGSLSASSASLSAAASRTGVVIHVASGSLSAQAATVSGVAGIQLTDAAKISLILKILSNRQVIDPNTGIYTLYDDDGVTVLRTSNAWEDAAGTIPFRGRGLGRLDAMQ